MCPTRPPSGPCQPGLVIPDILKDRMAPASCHLPTYKIKTLHLVQAATVLGLRTLPVFFFPNVFFISD